MGFNISLCKRHISSIKSFSKTDSEYMWYCWRVWNKMTLLELKVLQGESGSTSAYLVYICFSSWLPSGHISRFDSLQRGGHELVAFYCRVIVVVTAITYQTPSQLCRKHLGMMSHPFRLAGDPQEWGKHATRPNGREDASYVAGSSF